MPSEHDIQRFKQLATQVLNAKREAETQGSSDDAKLGMQGAAAWAYAYRVIFEQIAPQINQLNIWLHYQPSPNSSFVDDVLMYCKVVEDELERLQSYRRYYTDL